MKQLLLFTLGLVSFNGYYTLNAQTICNPAGNILIYSNYDGGDFTINIDENIPNLRIGLCSYADFHVTITGAYSSNVVEVLYAGYNADYTTSVTGVDAGIVSILNFPPVTLFDADGYGFMICAYECDSTYVPGGCNTVDQATDYFLTYLDGSIRYSNYEYGIYAGTFNMSDGGNCCFGAVEPCVIAVGAGQDGEICVGDSVQLKGTGAVTYSWTPAIGLADASIAEPYASPATTTTYILFGTDADGCSGTDTVTVIVYPLPLVTISISGFGTLTATGGGTYQWYFNGELIDGAVGEFYIAEENGFYSVEVTSTEGCVALSEELFAQPISIANSYLNQFINYYPNPANDVLNIQVTSDLIVEQVVIYNINGQLIQTLIPTVGNTITISVERFSAGLYTFKLFTNQGLATAQIILE